ncbi:MAG: hypothetical protein IPL08_18050 [Saprospiraceae bacterium]|nr:hypothetical protein [Saprospiraceae bacterium]
MKHGTWPNKILKSGRATTKLLFSKSAKEICQLHIQIGCQKGIKIGLNESWLIDQGMSIKKLLILRMPSRQTVARIMNELKKKIIFTTAPIKAVKF